MNRATFVLAGLVHGARRHLGVVAAVAVASAVLVGALAVGDSVRHTLGAAAAARTGEVDVVLAGGDRFFRAELVRELARGDGAEHVSGSAPDRARGGVRGAPVLQLLGVASTSRGDQRVHDVRVHGVDASFYALAPRAPEASPEASDVLAPPAPRAAHVSQAFASALGVAVGDTFVVRVERPSAIPRDLALAPDDNSAALRVEVERVLGVAEFGAFSLDASPAPPPSLFVDLTWLQRQMEVDGRVNLGLFDVDSGADHSSAVERLEAELERRWTLEDASLAVEDIAGGQRELVTRRIFLDEPVVAVLDTLDVAPLTGVFTYFVNHLQVGERRIPYSMVAALGPLGRGPVGDDPLLALSAGLGDRELRLNAWALADLGLRPPGLAPTAGNAASPPAEVELDYYVVDASRRLVTRQSTFTLAGAMPDLGGAPLEGSEAGRELMPDFPGLADADSCREWEPGTPVDLDAIRDVDEDYWDDYRGTPKAVLSLAAGRALWTSRFGALTGVRFAPSDEPAVVGALRAQLDAASVGLLLRDVRGARARAGESATDFGGLFIGLSFFLLVAALLLTTQLFLFGVEARARELGMLGAVGLAKSTVRRLVLAEAAGVAAIGAGLGAPLGLLYTQLVLRGLDTLWADAVARTPLVFHATWLSIALGATIAFVSTLIAARLALRDLERRSALELLQSERGVLQEPQDDQLARSARRSMVAAVIAALASAGLALSVDIDSGARASGVYFGAGALLVLAGLAGVRAWLHAPRRASEIGAKRSVASLLALGVTNTLRRRGRSFGTVASMALGVFLVLAVGANRLGPVADPTDRASGTGGFVYYGRTSLPLLHDLSTDDGRTALGLEAKDLADVSLVRLRVRDGDDASCLNLARPGAPRLLGVDPELLAERRAFPFAKTLPPTEDPWRLLSEPQPDGAVPAIGDVTSLTWQLKLGLGDTIGYVDERGQPFEVRIVAALSDTILQGDLVIAERHFEARFPSQSGHRRLLVDVPPERAEELRRTLTRALDDIGLALESSVARLDAFHAVQNTYLAIFQALGALGLLVGTLGLALLVLRNTEERRGELALLGAVGFARRRIGALVSLEYGALVALGLLVGAFGAALAMMPILIGREGLGALGSGALLLAAIAVSSGLWIVGAVVFSVRAATPRALGAE
jgi:putative ABC transport system permease protein